jgi:hypothetical protein
MFTSSTSPTVISEGVRSVLTVTSMSPKVSGGAWSPPSPCPKALGAKAGIVKIPIIAIITANFIDNTNNFKIPYLKIA